VRGGRGGSYSAPRGWRPPRRPRSLADAGRGAGPTRWFRLRRRAAAPLRTVGREPDYRFSFANERTFLAWIRTALALDAAGLAAVQLLARSRCPVRAS
jgi:hypothetical protein